MHRIHPRRPLSIALGLSLVLPWLAGCAGGPGKTGPESFEVRQLEAQPALSIRYTAPIGEAGNQVGPSFAKVHTYLADKGIAAAGPPFVLTHGEALGLVDLEVGVPITGTATGNDEITFSEIPAGPVATALHVGTVRGVGPLREQLRDWAEEQGHAIRSVYWEAFLNDPSQVAPNQVQMRLYVYLEE